jgi:hypothetical protein
LLIGFFTLHINMQMKCSIDNCCIGWCQDYSAIFSNSQFSAALLFTSISTWNQPSSTWIARQTTAAFDVGTCSEESFAIVVFNQSFTLLNSSHQQAPEINPWAHEVLNRKEMHLMWRQFCSKENFAFVDISTESYTQLST